MAERASPQYIAELAKEWEPRVRDAFLNIVASIRSNVRLTALVEMLERGDVNGAVRAVGLEPDEFLLLERKIAEAFEAGGRAAASRIPPRRNPDGYRVVFQFNIRNPLAEQWLRQQSSRSVVEIVESTREAIRSFLAAGLRQGVNPRQTALELVGRVGPSGEREGGVIGLSPAQERWARNYEQLLSDPSGYKRALEYELGNGNFDKTLQSAIAKGRALTPEEIGRGVRGYRNNALRRRGEDIARTETMAALGQSGEEAFRQAIARNAVDVEAVTKVWRTARDERVRHSHRQMNGQTVGFGESFVTPGGALLRFPADPLGPIEETANCRCFVETRIDHLRGIR